MRFMSRLKLLIRPYPPTGIIFLRYNDLNDWNALNPCPVERLNI
jgi:hypothetical protein